MARIPNDEIERLKKEVSVVSLAEVETITTKRGNLVAPNAASTRAKGTIARHLLEDWLRSLCRACS